MLKHLAEERGVSIDELIRQSVERLIEGDDRRERRRRALAVLGRYHDEATDVAVNHDRYLDAAYGDADLR